MGPRFKNLGRDTPLLLPPNLRDWLPADHLVHFVLGAVEALDLRGFRVNARGTGDEQFPPSVRLALLIYSVSVLLTASRHGADDEGKLSGNVRMFALLSKPWASVPPRG